MSGYRRFIAYVYEYQKGKKAGSCGFLKVEVRDSSCRMEIHLHCPGLPPETVAKTYGFFRRDGLMNGILLGSCQTQADMLECVVECNASNLGGSGMLFEDLGGVVILTESGGFFGTEWDDQPVRPENFQELKTADAPACPGFPETPNLQQPEMPESSVSEELTDSQAPASPEIPENQESHPAPDNSMVSCPHMPPKPPSIPEEQENHDHSAAPKAPEPPINQEQHSNSTQRPAPTMNHTQHSNSTQKETAPTCVEAADSALARQRKNFPGEEFSPFDDVDFLRCWKIHPNDLIRCSPGVRNLRNNRFLQYGFYNFGHLLLGVRPGGKYVLGVPGGYDQQERFMANMFGFPYFKESRMIELPRNRGGYWYRSIDAPNFR